MKVNLFIICVVASLIGCDSATNHLAAMVVDNEPTIVLLPGYKVDIDGKKVAIFGFDECPKSDTVMIKLFGSDSLSDSHACIVLGKDRQSVDVLVGRSTGGAKEQWTIVRETGKTGERPYSRTSLRRPDGSLVVPSA